MDTNSLTILQVFAQRYPRYLIKIINRHEEFYASLMVVVERYYLRKYSKSCQRLNLPSFSSYAEVPRCVICRELLWP